MKGKKAKRIQRFKQGKIKKTKNQILLEKRQRIIEELDKVNKEIQLGQKLDIHEALKREYRVYYTKKGGVSIGGKLSLPMVKISKMTPQKTTTKRRIPKNRR